MITEEIDAQIFNKIPKNAKIAIFGASSAGGSIYKDLLIKRKDVKTLCFIDNEKTGTFFDIKILKLKEFIDNRKEYDFVIVASISAQYLVNNILDVYDIPFVSISKFILDFYNGDNTILNDEVYSKIKNIFQDKEDKKLFDLMFKFRKDIVEQSSVKEYFDKNYPNTCKTNRSLKKIYLDKINKEKVKTVLDLGFNSGINVIAYNEELKNLKHIYGFEAVYDICRDELIEEFILNNNLTIVNYATGENNTETNFYINTHNPEASKSNFSTAYIKNLPSHYKEVTVKVIKLDDYCKKNKIKPDLIKADIEGSELPTLKGGIEIIKKSRPQLAISIYHSAKDFIEIPLYLYNNLDNYIFRLGQYSNNWTDTILYAIPKELA